MIDLHCHILPGVDDGAKTMEDSIEMAKLAVSEGISHILVTPHHMNRNWFNEKQKVIQLMKEVQLEIDKQNIPLTLFPGQEIRVYGDILQDIKDDKILFVDVQKQYLLIEFPTSNIPAYVDRLFFELESNNITPIIVHPERNREIIEHPSHLKRLVDKGALAQLTAVSYTGGFGKQIEKLSKQLIDANLVHFIASDAHNVSNRAFHMKEAYQKFEKEYGKEKLNQYEQVVKDLVNGEVVIPPSTQSVKKKKGFFGLF